MLLLAFWTLGVAGLDASRNYVETGGGIFGDACTGDGIQKYKYNGKELDRTHGLDTYDYGARMYDAALPVWDRPDPLAHKYYHVSPYVYCGNDPITRVDRDGRIWDTVIDLGFIAYDIVDAATQYFNTGSVSSTTMTALGADALAAVIPGVTGAGMAVRAGEKVAEAGVKANAVSKAIKNSVHGNSKASTKAQHAYDIINTERNIVVKTGVSGGRILNSGKSARAEYQVRKWNKEAGKDIYTSKITHTEPSGEGSRERILEYEKKRADELRKRGELDPMKHIRP